MSVDIKKKIKTWVNDIEKFKKHDTEAREFLKVIKNTGDKIGYAYGKIHNEEYESQEEMTNLMMVISELSEQKRQAETGYKELMNEEFSQFKKEFENIFELSISEEGIDQQTLNHVLDVYGKFQKREINNNQGINMGVDFLKRKYNLPDDFLTKLPESE